MPTLQRLQRAAIPARAVDAAAVPRRLGVTPDRIQSHGLDLSGVLKPSGTGLVWAAVEEGKPIAQSRARRRRATSRRSRARRSCRSRTSASASRTARRTRCVFVTRLDTAAPVPARACRSSRPTARRVWTGTTGADGVAIAPPMRLRDPRRLVRRVRLHRHGGEGRRRRLRRQRLERRHRCRGRSASSSTSPRRIRCCAARSSPIAASTSSARRSTSRRSCAATRPAASACCPKARRSTIDGARQPRQDRRRARRSR